VASSSGLTAEQNAFKVQDRRVHLAALDQLTDCSLAAPSVEQRIPQRPELEADEASRLSAPDRPVTAGAVRGVLLAALAGADIAG
jgi:hypothetical protein